MKTTTEVKSKTCMRRMLAKIDTAKFFNGIAINLYVSDLGRRGWR